MTQKLFFFLLTIYLIGGAISILFLREAWKGYIIWGIMMIGVLVWQIIQYNMTFGITSGPSKDINARFGLIGAIIWGIGGTVFISIMWRLIFPKTY